MPSPIHFRWFGVAGFELRVGGQVLLVDPFFTRPPLWNLFAGRPRPNSALVAAHVDRADVVLITHAHWDHLMDAPEVVRQTGAAVFGSPNTGGLLRASGVPEEKFIEIRAGDRLALGAIHLEVFAAQHIPLPMISSGPLPGGIRPPFRLRDYRMDTCFSFLLTIGDLRILDWSGESTAGAPPADVLLAGAYLDSRVIGDLLGRVRPRVVIPLHWDDFFRPLSAPLRPFFRRPGAAFPPLQRVDLAGFERTVQMAEPGCAVLLPELFQPYPLAVTGDCQRGPPGS